VLIGTQRRATAHGTTLRLAAPHSQVARVLHVTGLDRILSVHPTVAAALAEPVPGTPPRPPRRPYPGVGTPLRLIQPLRHEDPEITQPTVGYGRP
jgi:STAS domain-containing protein